MHHYLMYVSYAVQPMSDTELTDLLQKCRENNLKKNITGMLLYIDGKFIQVLEGKKNDISELFNTILSDKRHRKVSKIIEGRCVKRNFKDWTMGFRRISSRDTSEASGFNQIEDYFRNLEITESSHVTLVFLRLFYNKYYDAMALA